MNSANGNNDDISIAHDNANDNGVRSALIMPDTSR